LKNERRRRWFFSSFFDGFLVLFTMFFVFFPQQTLFSPRLLPALNRGRGAANPETTLGVATLSNTRRNNWGFHQESTASVARRQHEKKFAPRRERCTKDNRQPKSATAY